MLTVVSVTRPVTQVAVVAVKSASISGTAAPPLALIGQARSILPMSMTSKKLSIMICVVVGADLVFFFINRTSFLCL